MDKQNIEDQTDTLVIRHTYTLTKEQHNENMQAWREFLARNYERTELAPGVVEYTRKPEKFLVDGFFQPWIASSNGRVIKTKNTL